MKDQSRLLRKEHMFQVLEEFNKSGKTRKDFCADNKLAVNVFYYWQRKFREQPRGLQQGSFVMVNTRGKLQQGNSSTSVITVQYPNGVCLQVPGDSSPQILRTLISLI